MPGGYKNINGSDGNTFSSTNQPANRGRKPSIRNQLKELLDKDGSIVIKAKNVVRINEDGSVVIKLPTKQQAAMKVLQWAMSTQGSHSIAALKLLIEQVDGKPDQRLVVDEEPLTDAEREAEIQRLKESTNGGEQ